MTTAVIITGFLSAYALNPTVGTLAYRQHYAQIPRDLSSYEVFVAVADCDHLGAEATLAIDGKVYDALVFDCAGVADGGLAWMQQNAIAAEVDYWFWMQHPEYIGTAVPVELHLRQQ